MCLSFDPQVPAWKIADNIKCYLTVLQFDWRIPILKNVFILHIRIQATWLYVLLGNVRNTSHLVDIIIKTFLKNEYKYFNLR